MRKIRQIFAGLIAVMAVGVCFPGNIFADSAYNQDNPYAGWIDGMKNHTKSMSISPAEPGPGQELTVTMSEPTNHLGDTQTFLFIDASSLTDQSQYSLQTGTATDEKHTEYHVTLPTNVTQGATYDVLTAEDEGNTGFVFYGQTVIGPTPGHQLPEVPMAAIFPLLLLGGFAVFHIRKKSMGASR